MFDRRIPEWLRHAPTPGVRGFAILSGFEAIARGVLISVMPIAVYREFGDARLVSEVYFLVGLLSLAAGLFVPWFTRFVPRRFIYAAGCLAFITGAVSGAAGGTVPVVAGLGLIALATVTIFVCTNAYVLDYIARQKLGQCETSRLFYAAFGWTLGPALGVSLQEVWRPAPFAIAAGAVLIMLGVFLHLRLGNGRLITRAARPSPNPLAFLTRFAAQPRLVAGWIFAVIRSCGWWVYIVYLPIFVIENGLGAQMGGWLLSLSNGCLFLAPVMLRWMQRNSVRRTVRTGFLASGLCFVAATALAGWPVATIAALVAASGFLILLDVSAGLPFLMAVKPSERTEMSAIYASYRDVSGILTPGAAWLVLLAAPVSGLFATCGAGLLGCWWLARHLHPRLGATRIRVEPTPPSRLAPVPGSEPA
jgi:ACDE family multidrug resistance protein